MSAPEGQLLQVNGISLNVAEHGAGVPVILLHGWPDSGYLWRHQVPYLVDHGFRVIVPDLRGLGQSERPAEVAAYTLPNVVADVAGILDELGIQTAHVVGHDWGAAVAWFTAMLIPDRVRRLVVLSVPHPLAPATLRQREMAWYQLLFQFEGIAEAQLQAAVGEPGGAAGSAGAGPAGRLQQAFPVAMLYDADVFRAFIEMVGMLALPQEVLSRPGMAERIMKVAADHDAFAVPGPSRADVLGILGDQDAAPGGDRDQPVGHRDQRGGHRDQRGGRPA